MRRALVVLLLLGLARSVPAQTVTARLGGELTGFPGSVVLVPVAVDMSNAGGEKLGSYTARLTWDPTRLSACLGLYQGYSCVDSIHTGNFPTPQMNYDSAGGSLQFTAISPAGASGLITVARIPFFLRDTVGTALNLTFSEMSAAGSFTNLLPLLSVSSGTMCPARGRWGDLDHDQQANSRDALLTLSKVVGLPVDTLYDTGLADVNGDGAIQSVDALIILSYAVGIDIPGQRVLLLAPTSCGTGSAQSVAVFPASAQLVPNQPLGLILEARDSAGRIVTVSDAIWRSSDYSVAGIDGSGVVSPRAAGTATITGEVGPGVRASATITVIARRPNWFVDARATGAPLQLGTAAQPYDHPTKAFLYITDGDTIRVASGTYDFINSSGGDSPRIWSGAPGAPGAQRSPAFTLTDNIPLQTGAVIIGGTPGDTTTRPVLRAANPSGALGLWLRAGRVVIKNLILRAFDPGIEIQGATTVIVQDTRIESGPAGSSGDGIYSCTNVTVDTLRLDHVVMVGDSSQTAVYFGGCGSGIGARVVDVRDSKILRWGDGLYFYEVDSTAIVRSEVSDNDGYGVSLAQENTVNPSLYVAHSRIERNFSGAIRNDNARRVVVDTSFILSSQADGIYSSGGCGECSGDTVTQLRLRGDTIQMFGSNVNWLRGFLVDTAIIDATVVLFPDSANHYAYGYIDGRVASVTNSQFLGIGQGQAVQFQGSDFFADNVTMTGCSQPLPGCDGAYGFYLNIGGVDLNERIRNSSFARIGYPVNSSQNQFGVVELTNLTMDSVYAGIVVGGDSVDIRNNTITRAWNNGISAGGPISARGASISNNSVSCISPPDLSQPSAISVYNRRYAIDGNLIQPNCYTGLYLNAVASGTTLRGNTIRAIGVGITVYQYDSAAVTIDSNAVSGATTAGVQVQAGRVVMRHNNIGNNGYGVYIPTASGMAQIVSDNNSFTNNSNYAVYAPGDTVNAINNWWGNPAGPGGGVADSVSGPLVTTSPFLGAPPANLPSFSPRVLLPAPNQAASVRRITPARGPARVSVAPSASRAVRSAKAQRTEAERAARDTKRASRQATPRRPS
ncbi:MAG TPA: right-handed parallel beta-helix repeat-containing protein [Gemmatimonadales bacterium]|nr:right-handed parallel beta-helix repeat-containing protein [Gemmatimonadales bacterium]